MIPLSYLEYNTEYSYSEARIGLYGKFPRVGSPETITPQRSPLVIVTLLYEVVSHLTTPQEPPFIRVTLIPTVYASYFSCAC